MATAKKLPSGSWRCRIYDYTDEKGNQHYKSFTADTKRKAEKLADIYLDACAERNRTARIDRITVQEALTRYIDAKSGVLSPSTLRGYRKMAANDFGNIEDVDIFDLTSERLQRFISSLTRNRRRSPKTVSNIYGLLSAALSMFRPDAVFHVSLPKRAKQKKTAPSNRQIRELFFAADHEMKVCIALAAFGSMRRGEICALKYSDMKGDLISVHADIIENEDCKFVYKEIPKTSDSIRTVKLPHEVIKMIGKGKPDDFIVKRNPPAVTYSFRKLRDKLNLDIRFHDLRHYFASIGAVLGIPDTYMSDFGGWRRGSSVMKEVYQNVIEDEKEKYRDVMVDHFSDLIFPHENTDFPPQITKHDTNMTRANKKAAI